MRAQGHAKQLRGEGRTLSSIAAVLGVSQTTVCRWVTPGVAERDRALSRANKLRYRGVCDSCGGPTNGSRGPGTAAKVCKACLEWSDDAIIDAIRAWVAQHGIPPKSADWRAASPVNPSNTVVVQRIGWNEALQRAGCLRQDKRPETQARVEQLIRAGHSMRETAEIIGAPLTTASVAYRLRCHGTSVRDLRAA